MPRGEKASLAIAVCGIGVTVASTALGKADVDLNALLLWAMGGLGVLLALGGAVGAIVSWRQREATPDEGSTLQPPLAIGAGVFQLPEPQQVVHSHEPTPPDRLRAALTSLIRQGGEIMEEALLAGHAAERTLDRPSPAALAVDEEAFRRREAEWVKEVEGALASNPEFGERFSDAHGIPSTGHYAVANRLKARLKVLREIRDAL